MKLSTKKNRFPHTFSKAVLWNAIIPYTSRGRVQALDIYQMKESREGLGPSEVLKIDCALLHACVLDEEETLRERDAAVGEVKCTG